METRIGSISLVATNVLSALAIAIAVAGCFDSDASSAGSGERKNAAPASEPREDMAQRTPPDWVSSEQPILRYRRDLARDRLWILTRDGIDLYDARTHRKVVSIALPNWTWVNEQYNCAPDLTLGPRGEAVISSNVVPTLWRVDPVTFSVSEHELVLDEDTQRDIGFSGMAYSPAQGAFFAVSNLNGSLWRIDPQLGGAQKIPLSSPIPNACSLTIRNREARQRAGWPVSLCVRAAGGGRTSDVTLRLAPDQRSGYVGTGSCAG